MQIVIANHNNSVHVVWHNHVCAQFNMRKMFWDDTPAFVRDFAKIIQTHLAPVRGFPINHLAKQTIAPPGYNRDKICSGLGVIVIWQTDGTTMMDFGVKWGHIVPLGGRGEAMLRPYDYFAR
jgi:hypothetical protein